MNQLPPKEALGLIAGLFKGSADPIRVRLRSLPQRELCATDIAEAVRFSRSSVFHRRRIPKQTRPIKYRREGENLLYSLADERVNDPVQGAGTPARITPPRPAPHRERVFLRKNAFVNVYKTPVRSARFFGVDFFVFGDIISIKSYR